MKQNSIYSQGFTLVELIVVISIIAVLASIVYVSINPLRRFSDSRNAQRWSEIKSIISAIKLYQTDHNGLLPPTLNENWQMLGTNTNGCNVRCGTSGNSSITSFTDASQSNFNSGIYTNTQWSATNSWVELSTSGKTAGTGQYTSAIKNAASIASWQTFSWIPYSPYGKPLPNNASAETAYTDGNITMQGNVLLLHLDELSGTLHDTSGNLNNATNNGATYGVAGRFGTAMSYNGTTNYSSVPNSASLTFTGTSTFMAWVKTRENKTAKILEKGDWNGHGIYQDIWNGWKVGFRIGGASYVASWGSGIPVLNRWYHLVGVYDGSEVIIYVDGTERSRTTISGALNTNANPVYIGATNGQKYFNGVIDEVSIYNRALSAAEINRHYLRGALRLKYQVRSCDDAACSGETYTGPDGTALTYYSEENNTSVNLPNASLTAVANNQYFQYRASFETDNASYSPSVKSVAFENTPTGSGGEIVTQSSCLDVTSTLAPYLSEIPQDPKTGSGGKTYYAIRKRTNGVVDVMSCGAEGNDNIQISQ
ncbi:MAG: LamG-like jellyroll fold domain-containing protein [bacterium]